MKKIFHLILTSLLLNISLLAVAQQDPAKQIDTFIREAMGQHHIPGLAYAVVKDGKIIHQGNYGMANLSWNMPVDSETAFQTASCSKLFAALLLGRLFEEKLLLPEQKLKELLDSIPPQWNEITIKQLASHQSGIAMADFSKASNSKEALELAKKQEMTHEPGTRSFYVSSDYWVLQYIIEQRTGKPYFEALKQYVLEPLGMQHTYVNNNTDNGIRTQHIIPKEAAVYAYQENGYVVSDMQFGKTGYTAGGLYTSITDMAKIAQVLDKGTFLKLETQQLLLTPVALKKEGNGTFGIGFIAQDYQGHKVSGHSGGPALADFVHFDKQKLTFIVLTNQRGFPPYLSFTLASFFIEGLQKPVLPKHM
ncbi:serine hydrolase domain-containing protein [Rhodocytophaga aerolata]|uniref:Serine hydrolase domain-containing protein n=1 Tax=Rhodocytophaga aerolata TaxID=455078 RepID=A0ABT8RI05_9BACT|nr:serine hydrolase domain-containing protein [Rhodocytophaga aerolata]MDO1450803.1 serine hydrolase domain-containing protein [Rhodocytophaga aerolata]